MIPHYGDINLNQSIYTQKSKLLFNGEGVVDEGVFIITKKYESIDYIVKYNSFFSHANERSLKWLINELLKDERNKEMFINLELPTNTLTSPNMYPPPPPPPPQIKMRRGPSLPLTSTNKLNSLITKFNSSGMSIELEKEIRIVFKSLVNENFDIADDSDFDGLFGLFLLMPIGSLSTMERISKFMINICPNTDLLLESYNIIRAFPKYVRNLLIFLSYLYVDNVFPQLSSRIPMPRSILMSALESLPADVKHTLETNLVKLLTIFEMLN